MKNIYGQELGTEVDEDSIYAISLVDRHHLTLGDTKVTICEVDDNIWFAVVGTKVMLMSVADMLFMVRGADYEPPYTEDGLLSAMGHVKEQLMACFPDYHDEIAEWYFIVSRRRATEEVHLRYEELDDIKEPNTF